MAWALFNGETKISKAYEHKLQGYTDANERGYVLISRNQYWFQEGITLREVEGDREPRIGEIVYLKHWFGQNGEGKIGFIAHFTAPKFPAINKAELTDADGKHFTDVYPDRMSWDKEQNRWNYGS